MTFRLPVNTPYVNWLDGQKVLQEDMLADQSRFLGADAAIVNNFLGSGLILENPNINVIFDSDNLTSTQSGYVSTNDFDGRGIDPANQPTDSILGNQFEILLSDADVSLRRAVKVCIIGTDFQNNIQYETFRFYSNESQIGKKHFKTIISLLFNDFLGNKNGSRALGGRVIIREAYPMQLSRDEITASQNFEPNLFFRDFKVVDQTVGPNPTTILYNTLQTALGTSGYTVDALDINIGYVDKKNLIQNDISTRYGQKFQAKVNNIEKVRVLLGIEPDLTVSLNNMFDWSGDMIVSIHALQTSVTCPTDTIPDNAIDYQLNPSPIVQVILTQQTLKDVGLVLTDVAQPIDVIFTNTRIGGYVNTGITAGNYYAVTIQRAGDTTTGNIFTLTGRNYNTNSVFTEFNGSTWIDDGTLDLWFEIYSDALKVANGIGYDAGTGISIDKTIIDATTGSTIDYSADGLPFANNGWKVQNYSIVQAIDDYIDQIQDSRTGNPVFSRKQSSAEISTIISTQLSTIEQSSDPIILGCAADYNNKSTVTLTGYQDYIGLANYDVFTIVNPDPTLLILNLIGSKFIPDTSDVNAPEFLIYKVQLCTDGYGDLNGDGYIGADDIVRLNTVLLGEDITTPATQAKILAGNFTTLEFLRADIDGDLVISANDVLLINNLYNKDFSVPLPYGDTFQRLNLYLENKYGRNDDYHSSYEGYARLWDAALPRQGQYGIDYLLPLISAPFGYTETYYGYPVPMDLESSETAFTTVPFVRTQFSITVKPNWLREFIKVNYDARLLPCAFVDMTGTTEYDCTPASKTFCEIVGGTPTCSGGANNLFVPDNLIMGKGQLLSKEGGYYPVDMEVNTITLVLPALPIYNKALDLFRLFICEAVDGFTTAGYQCMKFADCSNVQNDALALNQIRFGVSLSSLSMNIDGYTDLIPDGYGAVLDMLVGTYIDPATGVLTIRGTNLYNDPDITFNCKILITVYLKKAGWKNNPLVVPVNQVENLLGL